MLKKGKEQRLLCPPLFSLILMTNVLSATLKSFKDLIRNALQSVTAKIEGAKTMHRFLGPWINETDNQIWLAETLGLYDINELSSFLQYAEASLDNFQRGRQMLDLDVRQQMYNFWVLNSEISVHRSNNRHIMKIVNKNIKDNVKNIQDGNLKPIIDEEGTAKNKSEAHHHIALHPYRKLSEMYCKVYKYNVSFSTFLYSTNHFMSHLQHKLKWRCACVVYV